MLMLLPQSSAFTTLKQRLDCVPNIIQSLRLLEDGASTQKGNVGLDLPFKDLLHHFQVVVSSYSPMS